MCFTQIRELLRDTFGVEGAAEGSAARVMRPERHFTEWQSIITKGFSKEHPMGQPVIHSDPDIQGGVPVFFGTRVPVKNLFDYLEAGDSLDDFLKSFPSVSRQQAVEALELAREALLPDAHPA